MYTVIAVDSPACAASHLQHPAVGHRGCL